MTRLPGATAAILRRLLALARDLLQAPDPRSVLELTGPAIQELLLADGALLLLALGDQEHVTEFDRSGGLCAGETISLMAFPFPPIKPVGALAVFWYHGGHPHQLTKPISVMRYIGKLTAAALGNVGYRQMIEGRIAAGGDPGPDTLEHRKLSPTRIAALQDLALHRRRAMQSLIRSDLVRLSFTGG